MNIERLYPIWFVLCASAGAIIGSATGHGAIRGLTDGMLIAAAPIFVLVLAHLLLMLWRPDLPACRCGRCRHRGYRYVGSADDGKAGIPHRFSCPRCGRVYELSDGRFDELANDGHTVPYMRHTKWGRWRKTEAHPPPAG
jgi:hypothetical protein